MLRSLIALISYWWNGSEDPDLDWIPNSKGEAEELAKWVKRIESEK